MSKEKKSSVIFVNGDALEELVLGDTIIARKSVCAKIDEVNWLSFISFSWIFDYLWSAYKGRTDHNRNWSCSIFDSSGVNVSRLEHLWNEELRTNPQTPSLFKVVLRFMRGRLIVACLIFLFCLVFGFIGPTCLIRGLISFTEHPSVKEGQINYTYGFYLVLSILVVEVSRVLAYGATWAVSYRTGIRVRGAILALLYKNMVNVKSLRNKTPAEIVNIYANDGQRIFDAVTFAPLVLIGPFVLIGGLIYLLRVIGSLSLLGISVFFVFDVLQAFLGIVMVKCRNRAITKTEKRMNLMGEIIKCIRVIKQNAWEELFIKRVIKVRNEEKRNLQIAGYAQSLAIASGTIVPVVATFVTVLSIVLSGSDILASDIFSAITVFFVMLFGIRMIPYGTRYLAESKSAISKIQELLLYAKYESAIAPPSAGVPNIAILMKNSTFSWDSATNATASTDPSKRPKQTPTTNGHVEQSEPLNETEEGGSDSSEGSNSTTCLRNLNLAIEKKEFIGVCGTVGSGKTALLHACLGHLVEEGGSFAMSGTAAFVSQVPFVCNTTIRENILFGSSGPMNTQRYYKAISSAQLTKDLESMPANELSEINESGTTLSGGQKARLALARGLYSNRDIYLLDDIFASVDKVVAEKIFKNIKEMLSNKTVLLVTSDPNFLAECDRILFLDQGQLVGFDSHEKLLAGNDLYNNFFNLYARRREEDSYEHDQPTAEENNPPKQQNGLSTIHPEQDDIGLEDQSLQPNEKGKLVGEEEDFGLSQISSKIYLEYIKAAGGLLVCIFVLIAFVVNVGSGIFSTYWLSKWLNDVHGKPNISLVVGMGGNSDNSSSAKTFSLAQDPNRSYYVTVYGVSLLVLFVSGLIKAMVFVNVTLRASTNLHNSMLKHVLHGVTSFFDSTPAGRILNRFSKDLDEIDVKLPFSAEALLQYMITCIGFIGIIAWVFPIFLILCLPLVAIFVVFFLCFRAGIRSLKRVENVSRSPVFEQISSSLDGLATIHSYSQTNSYIDSMKTKLDENSGAMFMFHSAMRWQAVWLDLLVVAVTFIVSCLIVVLTGQLAPAEAGMAIAFAMQMSGIFQFAVRSQTELESKLTSVERVSYYSKNIEQEPVVQDPINLPINWPSEGDVRFENVVLKYPSETIPALKGVSFDVANTEKIGIVGRTGSGKSSLCNALFQLYRLESGSIYINSEDISKISLARVRRAMSIIPQDPILFSGTLRSNIDPEELFSDDQIWECMDEVGFRETMMSSFTDALTLDYKIEESGKNLSSGQRQIVCVIRALLRNVKIVVLDEATANVDLRTDGQLQSTIRKAFAKTTVLLVTHRLNNLSDMDRIIMVEDGQITIRDVPQETKPTDE